MNIQNIHVEPLESPRTGEPVKNQYVIVADNTRAFQSYDSLIAVYECDTGILTLGRHWDYSKTTMKYLNRFLEEYCYSIFRGSKICADSIRKAINNGLIRYDPKMV